MSKQIEPRRRISRTPQVVINTTIDINDVPVAMRLELRLKPVVGYFWVARSASGIWYGNWNNDELLDMLMGGLADDKE